MLSDNQNLAGQYTTVTPSDTTVVGFRALYVGGSGTLVLQNDAGVSITFAAVAVGFFPVGGLKVMAASTATNIVALF